MFHRRRFLLGSPALALTVKAERPMAGGFVFESQQAGHRLRDRLPFEPPKREEKHEVAIVGGGIAGLSAAWWLQRKGHDRWVVLESEPGAGGNSRWGRNEVSAYPWAAHYVPVPNKESHYVRELFAELGLVDAQGRWDERWLCHSPQERLFVHGRWSEGVDADRHGTAEDRRQFQRFHDEVKALRATRRFTIPMAAGYRPSELDRVTMHDWLRSRGFTSPALDWEVDYSCRDDYGGGVRDVSAWAGLHYYAARAGEEKGPLTWPEGNGWILRRMLEKLLPLRVRTDAMARAITRQGSGWRVRTPACDYLVKSVIFAAPTFLLPYVLDGFTQKLDWQYSPWLTANLTIENAEALGETAWDNVIYQSPSLGYVVATHQSLRRFEPRSVWTFYWALTGDPVAQRRWLLGATWPDLRERILRELERAHPAIRRHVSRMDIFRMGHAMRRPVPVLGPVLGPVLKTAPAVALPRALPPGIFLANSDLSGFSIFEEAQYRGIQAAESLWRR